MNDLTVARTAITAALKAVPATYPVYDPVPQGAAKPYIAFGPDNSQPDEELATATTDAAIQIDTWSATADRGQSYAMLQFIRARLEDQTIDGAWFCSEDFNEVLEDPASTASSRLYHGVARYRVRVD
jgi:hypothetical protein